MGMMRRGLLCLALACGVAVHTAAAQAPTRVTLVQAHANIAIGEEIFLYAVPRRLGFFREEGLEVAISGVAGGAAAAQVLQSGNAQFATTAPEIVMQMREQGSDVVVFMNVKRRGGWEVAVPPGSPIRSLRDLRGRTIGVAGLGSGMVPILRSALAAEGLGQSDYTLVAAGTGAQAAAAVQMRRVDALGLWEAMYGAMENSGLRFDYIQIPVVDRLAGFSLATTDRFINANPRAVEGYCRAVAKGFAFTMANLPAAIRIFYEVFPQTRPPGMPEAQAVQNDANVMRRWLANAAPREGSPIGTNYMDMWEFARDYYAQQGMLRNPRPLAEVVTNRFTERCNAFDRQAIEAMARQAG
jgi:NitT/TauT family transport system substrate-binding protein